MTWLQGWLLGLLAFLMCMQISYPIAFAILVGSSREGHMFTGAVVGALLSFLIALLAGFCGLAGGLQYSEACEQTGRERLSRWVFRILFVSECGYVVLYLAVTEGAQGPAPPLLTDDFLPAGVAVAILLAGFVGIRLAGLHRKSHRNTDG